MSQKPRMKENSSREVFCDVECRKQIEEEGKWKRPSGFSDVKISGGLSKSCLGGALEADHSELRKKWLMKKERPKSTDLLPKGYFREEEKVGARGNVEPRRVFLICICCLIEETWMQFNAYKNGLFEKEH